MNDKIVNLFSEILEVPVAQLTDETSPANTPQWDSLAAMHLVVAIEQEFNIRLTTKEITQISTIGHAKKILNEKITL